MPNIFFKNSSKLPSTHFQIAVQPCLSIINGSIDLTLPAYAEDIFFGDTTSLTQPQFVSSYALLTRLTEGRGGNPLRPPVGRMCHMLVIIPRIEYRLTSPARAKKGRASERYAVSTFNSFIDDCAAEFEEK